MAPSWMTMANIFQNSSSSRTPSSPCVSRRCAVELTGRNSVSPSTIPRMIANRYSFTLSPSRQECATEARRHRGKTRGNCHRWKADETRIRLSSYLSSIGLHLWLFYSVRLCLCGASLKRQPQQHLARQVRIHRRRQVVHQDAPALREAFELPGGRGLEHVEDAEHEE